MNDNHGLTAANLLAAFPQVLQHDDGIAALASSIAAVLEKRQDEIRAVAIYPRIEELPEDLLDILAKDFKVDWWDRAYSLETKREILKNSWHTHRIIGTREAVTAALRTLYGHFEIHEWWEYGGDPGYFKVETSSFQILCEWDKFVATLSAIKRLSAHLAEVSVVSDATQTVGVGMVDEITLEISTTMEAFSLDGINWLVDETGLILMDERGNILLD